MVKSCRVVGGSWVLYGGEKFSGSMYVLSEGDYPNLSSMGLPADSRVRSGVLCEHSNYRGASSFWSPSRSQTGSNSAPLSCIGSLYPVRQKQRPFRIRNKHTGHCVSVQGGVEDMKTGRVLVSEQVEGMSDIWFYQDGLIKNKLARSMSLQVMGNVESAAKVVLWTETACASADMERSDEWSHRQPHLPWDGARHQRIVHATVLSTVIEHNQV
ncbi:beta/gamma crystallin domain-containing protein 2-like [Danio aesculapii]|uniref:beta/gamma crystallin domain-containing protein 2-like n=1 Tax=Danio aesculapii TaxID=1142201 RepID=UPI0024C09988|nr:beta/gamma crystallin domain-containing protein 2-like [Danio aesculapii]